MTDKPKWQRARIIHAEGLRAACAGRLLWIRGPRRIRKSITDTDGVSGFCDGYDIHLTDEYNRVLCVDADHVELLCRDEKDFADEVPLIPRSQWLAEKQP